MSDTSSSSVPIVAQESADVDRDQQVRLKSEGGKLLLMLPPEGDGAEENPSAVFNWDEIWQQLNQRLNAGERFWQADTTVHLIARDRLLDVRQLQAIADALTDSQLQLKRVYTSRRQTAVAAATAGYSVDQQPSIAHLNQSSQESGQMMADPLYLETTLRSGADIQHNGTVIVLGDVNPGGSITAEGDILVWGRLRGVAHAGSKGNARCLIMALQMEPTQIRIADFVARAPESSLTDHYPEVAYVTPQGAIHIARAYGFSRSQVIEK